MTRTGFVPTLHGFHFGNYFVNKLFHLPPPFNVDVETRGRCGGMAFAALDYYFAHLPIPTHQPADFNGSLVPPDGHPLADYIYDRLMDTFVLNGLGYAGWTQAPDQPALLRGKGVIRMTKEDEIPKLMNKIDAGEPVALALIIAGPNDIFLTNIGNNHQVVAYGYDVDAATRDIQIYIYDNNDPDQEVVLKTNLNDMQTYVEASNHKPWRGLFVQNYIPRTPHYIDLALCQGISVSSWYPILGSNFQCQYTVKNYGTSPAHLQSLSAKLSGPSGEDLDYILGSDGNGTPINPGENRIITKASASFGTVQGPYQITASYLSEQGHPINLPVREWGTVNQVQVNVGAALRTLSVRAEPNTPKLGQTVAMTVFAKDSALLTPVDGRVWISDLAPVAQWQEVGSTNQPFQYFFRRRRVGSKDDWQWVYPRGKVSAAGYEDAPITFFPEA